MIDTAPREFVPQGTLQPGSLVTTRSCALGFRQKPEFPAHDIEWKRSCWTIPYNDHAGMVLEFTMTADNDYARVLFPLFGELWVPVDCLLVS